MIRLAIAAALVVACKGSEDAPAPPPARPVAPAPVVAAPARAGSAAAAPIRRAPDIKPPAKIWPGADAVAAAIVILDALAGTTEYYKDEADCTKVGAQIEENLGALLGQRTVVTSIARSAAVRAYVDKQLNKPDSPLSQVRKRAFAPIETRCPELAARIDEAAGLSR